ncbi:AAEL005328-PA, partial [Aedes aegypti]
REGQCLLWTSQRKRHVGTGNTGRPRAQLDLAESRCSQQPSSLEILPKTLAKVPSGNALM